MAGSPKKPHPTDKYVGAQIRLRRMTLGLTQTQLADAVDLTFQQIQKYEKGVNRVSASRMQQLADILKVPVAFFFQGAPGSLFVGKANHIANLDYFDDFLTSRDGHSIMKAFNRIRSRAVRQSVVALTKQIAERNRKNPC